MYNLNDIQSNFFTNKLLTFKSSLNGDSSVLDSDLTGVSKSKRYFNTGVHPLITLENIEAMLPVLSDYTITAYAVGTTYDDYNTSFSLTDVVLEDSKYYISIDSANIGNDVTDTDYWKETTLMSLILKDKIRTSIEIVLSELITPNFIEENVYMFRVGDNTDDLIENTDKIVGYRIMPTSSDHLQFLISQIGLNFESNETIELKLYNQNKLISTFSVDAESNYFVWKDIDELEISSNTGAWYLLYDQTTLTGRAIGNNTVFYTCMDKYASITPFEIDSVDNLATIDDGDLTYDRTYGLNLNFSVSYDMTQFITQHMRQLAECFQRQFEYDILNLFYYNPDAQVCLKERNINYNAEKILFEIKSFEGNTVAMNLRSAYKRMKATIAKLGQKDSAFIENEDDNFTVYSM